MQKTKTLYRKDHSLDGIRDTLNQWQGVRVDTASWDNDLRMWQVVFDVELEQAGRVIAALSNVDLYDFDDESFFEIILMGTNYTTVSFAIQATEIDPQVYYVGINDSPPEQIDRLRAAAEQGQQVRARDETYLDFKRREAEQQAMADRNEEFTLEIAFNVDDGKYSFVITANGEIWSHRLGFDTAENAHETADSMIRLNLNAIPVRK